MLIRSLLAVALTLTGLLPDGAAQAEDGSRVRTRLLRLADGGVVRARSRFHEDRWRVQRDGHWIELPAGSVVDVRIESDVLGEARKRTAKARKAGPRQRIELAEWMLDEGLLTEAFSQLDQVLTEHPDQQLALDLLARYGTRIALPSVSSYTDGAQRDAAIDRLIDFAGRAPISIQELAVLRLRGLTDPRAGRARLARALTSPHAGNRAFAPLALRRLAATDPEPELLRRALVDPCPEVRRAAGLALRDTGDETYLTACMQALDHRASIIRQHAAEALGTLGQPAAVEPLMQHLIRIGQGSGSASGSSGPRGSVFIGTQRSYVQGFDANVAANSAIAEPVIGVVQSGASLDVRALGSSGPVATRTESQAVRVALGRITGEDPGATVSAWTRWWDHHREAWLTPHEAPAPPADAPPRERW